MYGFAGAGVGAGPETLQGFGVAVWGLWRGGEGAGLGALLIDYLHLCGLRFNMEVQSFRVIVWEGYRESRRCSTDTYPESYITLWWSWGGRRAFV